jgi:hypothetical protein
MPTDNELNEQIAREVMGYVNIKGDRESASPWEDTAARAICLAALDIMRRLRGEGG